AFGAAFGGWAGEALGLPFALGLSGLLCAAGGLATRHLSLDPAPTPPAPADPVAPPRPEPADPALAPLLATGSHRVLEAVRYRIAPEDRTAFLAAMAEARFVRQRCGALAWRLWEDVAHPDRWVELWVVDNWAEHLREAERLTEPDRAILGRAAALHRGEGPPEVARYLDVVPDASR
ncbi:MFS transporter, partial [Falsiroseomonas oryziterrae]|uniref:MFS transporter n=1 Tax=Falsiroseomonas oryziterrae TaxID=2911368 RepID=UPI001F3F8679